MTLSLPYRSIITFITKIPLIISVIIYHPFPIFATYLRLAWGVDKTSQYGIRRCSRLKFESRLFGDMGLF